MERRGFYIFNIDTLHDEQMALAALTSEGIRGVVVMARERDEARVYVEYDHEKPLPLGIRDKLRTRGVLI